MTKKLLLISTLGIAALGFTTLISLPDDVSRKYTERLSSHMNGEAAIVQGAYEYHQMLKGDFTKEDWKRARLLAEGVNQDRSTFNWVDEGPDNVGGRTRAIISDRNNINHIYAGSVSGGLFESLNRGNTWQKVDEFENNLSVSSICQTIDGTFYVATGHQRELSGGSQNAYDSGANGYGIYRSEPDGSWILVEGTEIHDYINEVVCDDFNNEIWYATTNGLKKYDPSTGEIEAIDAFSSFGPCLSLAISKDGTLLVGHSTVGGGSIRVSNNGGSSFTEVSDLGETANVINMNGVGRIEFAVSHEKIDGNYRVYGSAVSGQTGTRGRLKGIWRSADNGNNWNRIAPEYNGMPGGFSPFQTGAGTFQGLYDNIITVVPGAPDKILLGGINCYSWSTSENWKQISISFLNPTNPLYIHADNHEFHWDASGRLYVGNDGGISISNNAGSVNPSFYTANRGYNVTQFYATGVSAHGDVIGGTQDNGTKANYHDGTTYQEHKTVGGNDGFSSHISFINRDIIFTSFYYSAVFGSSDRGENSIPLVPTLFTSPSSPCSVGGASGLGSCGQFFTNFEVWEDPSDLASTDSVQYIPSRSYGDGESIDDIGSAVTNTFIDFEAPFDLIFEDTVNFDPSLTTDDILVIDLLTGNAFNLNVLDWEFINGAPVISEGDSIRVFGVEISDTIIVENVETINHYWGTNPLKPGKTVDMGNDPQIYNIAWDTLKVQDPYQSWFTLDMGSGDDGGGIWMTRNALRFSAPSQDWFKIKDSIPGEISSMEYSKDGNYLFIGTFDGRLYRYTGFNSAYSPTGIIEGATISGITYDTLVDHSGNKFVTEFSEIEFIPGGPITGIASGPIDNPDYLVITIGNFLAPAGKVRRSTNAAAEDPDFEILSEFPGSGIGAAEPGIPCYSVIVDRDNSDIIVVGTEFGVFATEDGGDSWNNISGGFGNTPVFDMQQNWRTWEEGCKRPGEIYIGTHGRGIWSSDALLSTKKEGDNFSMENFSPNLTLFPNPLKENGTVDFNLEKQDNIYLQLFNLNGQLVHEVSVSNLQPGKNQLSFETDALSKGTYILRLKTTNFTETTKFIKH